MKTLLGIIIVAGLLVVSGVAKIENNNKTFSFTIDKPNTTKVENKTK